MNFPDNDTLQNLCKLSIAHDKPIHFNYWIDSQKNKVIIGKCGDDKVLYVDEEEYTSPIEKLYKVNNCYIIITSNSIYVVHTNIEIKNVSLDL